MNKTLLSLLATAAIATSAPALAQNWQNINQRQAQLDQRIDQGVRNGQLTRQEATRLQAEFQQIAQLENNYRRDGLTAAERADLDRRFDRLAMQISNQRQDGQRAGGDRWQNINQRQAQLDQRIDLGVRNGQLTRAEAVRLRGEFQQIARLENEYRRNGLTAAERADLDRRFDRLAKQISNQRQDGQRADGRWENLNQRQAQFRQRLDTAVRDRRITQAQASNLAGEFRSIADLEQRYRRGGLSAQERADLNLRFDRLQANFRGSIAANQYGYGYGQAPNLFDYLFGVR
ncbi:MAG: hypothetical protein U1C74_06345 [Phenylobacterium sp.]|nr:hypothetical protein [Phenylobacterium sp.]